MAAEATPLWLQTGSHDAEHTRRGFSAVLANKEGIVTSGALVVSQKSGTPNMSVDVAEGQLVLAGDEATYQGHYLCEARGVTNLTIAAADPTNPRRDLIIARVRDSAYSGATNTFSLEVVQGTPAGSPADPSLPTGSCYVLARVAVAASAASIVNANVTDGRTTWTGQFGRAAALGGTIVCTSTTRPTVPFEGLKIYETDTDLEYTYDGSAWLLTAHTGAWTSYTPTWTQSATITKTVGYAKYRKVGRSVTGNIVLNATGSGTASNLVVVSTPVTTATAVGQAVGAGYLFDASTGLRYGFVAVLANSTTFQFVPTFGTYAGLFGTATGGFTAAVASGDAFVFTFDYESAS